MIKRCLLIVLMATIMVPAFASVQKDAYRIKQLCRLTGVRDNSLVGYGLVTGLAGTGDTARTAATFQSLSNVLEKFGIIVPPRDIRGRNVAAVMIVATLPPFARSGDKMDVNITSLGDARSLVGGTLLRTHLKGPDGKVYALAQGPVSVGGFSYDLNGNVVQKNHPTAAYISGGAVVEKTIDTELMDTNNEIEYVLFDPDFTTASRIADSINDSFSVQLAKALDAGRIKIKVPPRLRENVVSFITQVENIAVTPDRLARVVVNERTGTVVAGGNVTVSDVSITHGDLKLIINTEYDVSQPSFVYRTGDDVRTEVVPKTTIEATEEQPMTVNISGSTTVADLVSALNKVKATSRDVITILQTIKRAGGLHAELIIQ
ncbi:MAG: flagellar basal body P-ring protein FlgI [Gammaproteobacteria bacterium]